MNILNSILHCIRTANTLFLSSFLLFFVVNLCFSQTEKFVVSGTVNEKVSGEAITGIAVALYEDTTKGSKAFHGNYTNKYGFYSIPDVSPGKYFIVARGIGYTTYKKKIELDTANLRVDIELMKKDIKMQEIVVESEREVGETKNISSVNISPDFIGKMPSLGGEVDVFRSLQLLPGVQQATELSSGLYIRGGSPDQNLTLLDNVIVYNPSHLGGFLSSFNSDALRDVRLIKGAFPAEYGGRLSSVIDLTMREGTKEKISGSGGVSMISSKLMVEGPITENSTFMISGRRMYLDLFLLAAADDDEVPRYYFYDLNAKTNLKLSESDRLFVSGYFGNDVLGAPPSVNDHFDLHWGNRTLNARWMHIESPSLFTNFSFIYTNYNFQSAFEEEDNSSDFFKSISKIEDFMLRGEAEYFPDEDHTIKAGFESVLHTFKARATSDLYDIDQLGFETKNKVRSFESALYVQDEWDVNEKIAANLGMRFVYFGSGNYFNVEPRLSGTYKLTDKISLKGAFAVVNQNVHLLVRNDMSLPTDLWFPSTESVKPSRSWQAVLGAETTFGNGKYFLSGEIYYKDMRNLYQYKDDAEFSFGIPLESQFTRGKGEAYGMEIFLNRRIGNLTGWIGYTLAWTNRTFPELNNGKTFPPRYDRRHDIKIALTYELGESWELGAAWVFGTGQAYTLPTGVYSVSSMEEQFDRPDVYYSYRNEKFNYTERNGARLPTYHRLDLNFMHKYEWFGLPFTFSINIYNAYNRKNPFAWYLDSEWNWEEQSSRYKVKQITLFPIIPTFGLSFKF